MTTTIADVAAKAGVSTATVSRVLSGLGRASAATQARVLQAARELDYRPSEVARSLKRRSTQTLGLIITDIENPYFPQLVRSVEDAARAAGYSVLLCNAADDPDREASYLELLADRRVDGLVIAASSLGARHGDWLTAPPIPVVLVNTAAPDADLPTIMSDNEGGGRMVAEHLVGLGHQRFGYLMPPPRNVDAPARLAGVRRALRDADMDANGLEIARGEALVWGGEVAANELLDRAPETTAFVAYNDLMAIGALRALRRRGRRVPADASVVGFDDVALAAYVDPPLTTISQRTEEMGRWAVERLIGEDGVGPSSVQLPVDLQVRGSSGPAPA
ncbi:MAG TPA: LacI family DNA-binding transcriptional regulator [Candidatus Limnocylindrales bacterium]|nr:LacI family DNA-binding transcriptional regulator [Candidatus Limnocylindrales bacterium]